LEKLKEVYMKKILGFFPIIICIIGCASGASGTSPAVNSGGTTLDTAIAETAGRMETRLNEGTKIALINFSSSSAQLSEYVMEGISLHLVNSGKLIVVDRANLDRVRQEQGFQLSGDVSDESAKAIGQMLGADAIVTGSLANIGREYRINLKAISVDAATVVVQYAADIIADERVRTLLTSGGGSGGGAQSTSARTSGSSTGTSGTNSRAVPAITSVTVSPDSVSVGKGKTQQFEATVSGNNNPDLTVAWTVTGNLSSKTNINEDGLLTVAVDEIATPLTVTATSTADQSKNARAAVAVPGGISAINVSSVANWNSAINTIRNGGNNQTYIINVTGNVLVPAPPENENIFGSVTGITVTIQGNGTLSLSVNGSLLHVGAGQTVVVKDVTLRGRSDNNAPVVRIMSGSIFRMEGKASLTGNGNRGIVVEGATFTMQDNASVTGNSKKRDGSFDDTGGGGVLVNNGNFVMQSGTISGNSSHSNSGGGVFVIGGGNFIMQGGTISGNTSSEAWGGGGGGVCVARGTFIMENGTILGNTSTSNGNGGGGVYVNGTFTMKNGTISGNTSGSDGGGGVYVSSSGTFIIQGGIITNGNNTQGNGGGVYVNSGTFTKTGGTITGSDMSFGDRNTAQQGHAVYLNGSPVRWRNATAGQDDKSSGYGFWLND
jgi:TolB-like protein